ncbi:ferric-dicitrate binding protein FerR (iron transport regulator) [Flavobacterium arsenatis]|uniref:Ferric-dicitrate binding protein FerR (Iron transport regulator) n=1 Tax=Flavobacterium arsenatis TaxID=1484332 RepID=A0ABU1TQR1_9FLAO|nr:FecR family protein [Flavobacterium arsenatis]MDR6968319.1 ferric-dicitrate binding protein FerR (iron transport regulator) [Flavobacterium arsenatis]
MVKKLKHNLESLLEKSEQKKTSNSEEQLLNDFMQSAYEKSEWVEAMGEKNQASEKIYTSIQKHINKKKVLPLYFRYAVAASIALLFGLGYFLSDGSPEMVTFKTAQLSDSIQLEDGSIIYLAANSVFEYPETFDKEERAVKLLKGNAFFEVTKDPEHPFIITSGAVKTKVLGTSFHIQLSKAKCNVMVVTGKVNVSSKNQSIDLLPNEEVSLIAGNLFKEKSETTSISSFYKENTELNNVSLKEVFKLLEYKYGINMKVKNKSVLDTRLTLFIERKASLESILNQINYITNLKFKLYEDTVTVN